MLAALALHDLFTGGRSSGPHNREVSPREDPEDEDVEMEAVDVPVSQLLQLPDTSDQWPLMPGKGWFAKNRRGSEIHFLERIFLMLSFGNLRLRKSPTRSLRETIRWLEPEEASRLGVPDGLHAFEIAAVELFESEVYPQYASGSFNKTAGKWCIVSPGPSGASGSRKLSRACMYLPATWTVDGVTYDVDAQRVFRPLPPDATATQVYDYTERCVRALQEQHVRQVYRLKEETERRRKLGVPPRPAVPLAAPPAAAPAATSAPPPGSADAEGLLRRASAASEDASRSASSPSTDLDAGRTPDRDLDRSAGDDAADAEVAAACAADAAALDAVESRRIRAALEQRVHACFLAARAGDSVDAADSAAAKAQARSITPPAGSGAPYTYLTPNPTSPPSVERPGDDPAAFDLATLQDRARTAVAAARAEARAAAVSPQHFGDAVECLGRPPRPPRAPGSGNADAAASRSGCSTGAESPAPSDAPPVPHSGEAGLGDLPAPAARRGDKKPACTGARSGARSEQPLRLARSASDRSAGSAAASAIAGLSLGRAPPQGRGAPAAADSQDVFPFAPGKGWFAFNRQGKSVFFLERLFRMLSSPAMPLRRHDGAVLGDVVRWMDADAAAAQGVPQGVQAFEVVSTDLFENEVYPQFKSGSFRKTAKHWCVVSPQASPTTQQKLSVRCMFVPAERPADSGATEPIDCHHAFRQLDPALGEEEIEEYIQKFIRPLEERIRGALLSSTAAARERASCVQDRELLPPEKRTKRAAGAPPPLAHSNSCHL